MVKANELKKYVTTDIYEAKAMIEILSILLVILPPLIGFLYNRHRKLRNYYSVIWEEPSSLILSDLLGERGKSKYGFHDYYYERKEDRAIKKKLENNENVLIIGNPLSGKSRAIYQALINIDKPCDVIIPRPLDIKPEDFRIPYHFGFWMNKILILDDLNKFTEKENFEFLLNEFLREDILIIASCRSGPEYDIICKKLETKLSSLFGNVIELPMISEDEGKKIAEKIGKILPSTFDGNIGSIFLPLDAMKIRFNNCNSMEKGILLSLKQLYYAGIFEEREIFYIKKIKEACRAKGIEMKDYEWKELFEKLENKGFVALLKKNKIWIEETYLEYVVEDDISILNNMDEMIDVFSDEPETLYSIGNEACNIGFLDVQRKNYMKKAIKALKKGLENINIKNFQILYGKIQNTLGKSYFRLAEVENRAENCRKGIHALKEALKVRTIDEFPFSYAETKLNLGITYFRLAEVENKAENCKKGIESSKKALKIFTIDEFPIQFAETQNSLGITYFRLAEVENRAENCRKAIHALKEALKVRTIDEFPLDYAMTQTNLAGAYVILAETRNVVDNSKKAIESSKKALKIFTIEKYPVQYATAQINLAIAHFCLSVVQNKAENSKKAIESSKKALKIFTIDEFPIQFAETQNTLGVSYYRLAEVENKAENCRKGIHALKEALKVRTIDEFPLDYAMTQTNLGALYHTLAEVLDKIENSRKAIIAYHEALKIFSIEKFPYQYAVVQGDLAEAYVIFSKFKNKAENCRKAIESCKEALKIFTIDEPSVNFSIVQNTLGNAYYEFSKVENKAENSKKAIRAYQKGLTTLEEKKNPELYHQIEKNLKEIV